jgi:poly-gamma-glutamate synthesis protein (capsule biosynthesis protein)
MAKVSFAVPEGARLRSPAGEAGEGGLESRARLLAVGDINLGRRLGQRILAGDTLHPFRNVREVFAEHDLVFGNLESTLSDQNGETEHPSSNMVFTGPPAGAWTLRRGGIDVVSTANNHALDYGEKGREETVRYLRGAGVLSAGTGDGSPATPDSVLPGPALLERNGIRFAFFACTAIMNQPGEGWKKRVAPADTSILLPLIRKARREADVVVVSYHGGNEYSEHASAATVAFARGVIDGGADLFLGHHPHVPYGIERRGGGLIVHSLGNFVFLQPSRFWTRWGYALSAEFRKGPQGTRLADYGVLPVRCGFQPEFARGVEADSVINRVLQRTTFAVMERVQ